jgi:hypothetical protein
VVVADEHHSVGDRRKEACDLFRSLGWSIEVPEVLNLLRVQPRLDVREQAALDLQAGLKTAHVIQTPLAISSPVLGLRVVPAETEVVIAPDTDGIGFGEEGDGLFQAVSHLAQVAQNYQAIDALAPKDLDRPPQVAQVLMDVRQDADLHADVISSH